MSFPVTQNRHVDFSRLLQTTQTQTESSCLVVGADFRPILRLCPDSRLDDEGVGDLPVTVTLRSSAGKDHESDRACLALLGYPILPSFSRIWPGLEIGEVPC